MNSLELVVCRYAEEVQWVRRVPRRMTVTVYNKGEPLDTLPRNSRLTVCPLANVGREDQAYLHHVVHRYDSLADVTVFAQGKPFDHAPSFHRHLHDLAFQRLKVNDFLWLGFIIDEDDHEGGRLFQRWSKNVDRAPLPLSDFWQKLWDEPAPERVIFYPGAQFMVTADCIRRRPRAFYERALALSKTLPLAAHCFERVWDRIFQVNGVPAHLRGIPRPVYLRDTRKQARTAVQEVWKKSK